VWNWFDPVTLLRAMPEVLARHPSARLVFLGSDHPHPDRVAHMERAEEARALGRSLGLEGRSLFWLDWVPYAARGAYLLEADVGVSLHGSGVEPLFAFRTRLLDLVWARLPAVVTRGDVLSEELVARGLALGVEPGDAEAVAAAINALLDEPEARRSRQAGFDDLCKKYRWDRVCEPLERFCAAPRLDASKQQAAAQSEEDWGSERAALMEQICQLQSVVRGYESGRLMQLMAALQGRRRR
jgi:glycosyltransferase involved in cell wall biosynthesis